MEEFDPIKHRHIFDCVVNLVGPGRWTEIQYKMFQLYNVDVKKPSILRRFYRKIYQPQAIEICDNIIPEIVILGIKNNFKSNNTKNEYDQTGPNNDYGNKFYTCLFKKYIGRCMRILVLCFMRKKREMLGNFQLIYMRPVKNFLRLIDRNEDEIKDQLGVQIRKSAILFKKILSFLIQDKWFKIMDNENTDRYYLYPEFLKLGERKEIVDLIEHMLYVKEIYQILYIDRYHFCPDKSKYLKRTEAENKDTFVYKMFYEGSAYQKYYKKYIQAQAQMLQENRQDYIYMVNDLDKKKKINSKIKYNNVKHIRTIRGVIRSKDRLPNQFIGQAPYEFCNDLLKQQDQEQLEHDIKKKKGIINEQQIEFNNIYLDDPLFKDYIKGLSYNEDDFDILKDQIQTKAKKAIQDQELAQKEGYKNKRKSSIRK